MIFSKNKEKFEKSTPKNKSMLFKTMNVMECNGNDIQKWKKLKIYKRT